MKDTKNIIALISLGVLTIGSFIASKIYDKKVDKEIEEHEEELKRYLQDSVNGVVDSIPRYEVDVVDDDGNVIDFEEYCNGLITKLNESDEEV